MSLYEKFPRICEYIGLGSAFVALVYAGIEGPRFYQSQVRIQRSLQEMELRSIEQKLDLVGPLRDHPFFIKQDSIYRAQARLLRKN